MKKFTLLTFLPTEEEIIEFSKRCHICGKSSDGWLCRDCEEYVCENCTVPFTFHNQIDYTLCCWCYND